MPTVISAPPEAYAPCLANLARDPGRGAVPLGVHVEGPFLSPERNGTHERSVLRHPSWPEVARWLESGIVRIVTLAPELPGALSVIRGLSAVGVTVALGHTDATWRQAESGVEAGASLGTHLFNAMRPFSHRDPGVASYFLTAAVPVSFIGDRVHLVPGTLQLIGRTKRAWELILVTDFLAGLGQAGGAISLAGQQLFRDGDVARRSDGTLSGSLLPLNLGVRNLVEVGWPIVGAVRSATLNPAGVIGDTTRGRLKVGARADVVVVDDDWAIVETFVAGESAYARDRGGTPSL